MTEYYDPYLLKTRHAVYFNNPKSQFPKTLYYYDFDTESWIRCYPHSRLPYNLYCFTLDGFPDDKVVVTCKNSYRLSETIPIFENINKEFMKNEKKWRDELVVDGAEFDFNSHSNYWAKGVVCWTKSDIIPGVIVGGQLTHPNINGFGHIYKEDKKLAKSCTHTSFLTQDEINKQIELERIHNEYNKKLKDNVKKYTLKVGMKVPKEYRACAYTSGGFCGRMGFIDPLPFYQTLKRHPTEITLDNIKLLVGKEEADNINIDNKFELCIIANNLLDDSYTNVKETADVVFTSHEQSFNNKIVKFNKGANAFCDIIVYNATYAYLWCGDGDPLNPNDPSIINYNRRLNMELINDGVYSFSDITYENPLFGDASPLYIISDGTTITYKSILINYKHMDFIHRLGNSYYISHFPKLGRILLNGLAWQPSMSFAYDELIDVPVPDKN